MAGERFGRTKDGETVSAYTLERKRLRVRVIDFGAVITRIETPDRAGTVANVVLGLDTVEGYEERSPHFGGLVGRYANRIAHGRFTLDGTTYQLPVNEPPHTLHGGNRGFDRHLWRVVSAEPARLVLARRSPDGEEGFPGNLDVEVTYSLPEEGTLRIDYAAQTDRPTVVNLTNHSYFNLAGEGSGDAFGHRVQIAADAFLPTDATQIPTGERRPVAGTPFDLRDPVPVGTRIRDGDEQLTIAGGFDHAFLVRGEAGRPRPAASAVEPVGGRRLDVATTLPSVQFYTANNLDGSLIGPGGRIYRSGDAVCFETQAYPDAPNHPDFPSTVLRPGERFSSSTTYRFSVV